MVRDVDPKMTTNHRDDVDDDDEDDYDDDDDDGVDFS